MKAPPLAWLRRALLISMGGFLAYIVWLLFGLQGGGEPEPMRPPRGEAPAEGEAAHIETMDFIQSRGEEESLRILAQDMTTSKDGSSKLEGARISLPAPPGEETWTAEGDEAEVRDQPREIRLAGNVVVTSSEGGRLETDALVWDQEEGVVRSEGEVRMWRDDLRARGDRLRYAIDPPRIVLEGEVRGTLLGSDGRTQGRLEAQRILHDADAGLLEISGGVRLSFDGWRLVSQRLHLDFDGSGEVSGGRAEGQAVLSAAEAQQREMRGERIELRVREGEITELHAYEGARARLGGGDEASGDALQVRAEEIRVEIGAERKARLLEAFAAGEDRVEVTGLPGAPGAQALSERLRAELAEEGGAERATFLGDVLIRRDGTEGLGRRGDWAAGEGLVLTGAPGIHAPQGKAYGREVRIGIEGDVIVEGNVHSMLEPREDAEGSDAGEPLFREGSGPVYVSASRLSISSDGATLFYEGDPVQAKQGDSSILAPRLRIEGHGSTVRAEGGVRSKIRLVAAGAGGQEPEVGPLDPSRLIEGRSEALVYTDPTVVYEGEARLQQGDKSLAGDRIEIHLVRRGVPAAPQGERIGKIDAAGDVEVAMGTQKAWGDRLEYEARDDLVLVYGDTRPARAEDRARRSRASGRLLTLDLDAGTVFVEADPRGRTASSWLPEAGAAPATEAVDGDPGS